MRKYVHLRQSAFNCAKCTLYKDICIIVNIQLSLKTFINVLQHSVLFFFYTVYLHKIRRRNRIPVENKERIVRAFEDKAEVTC